VEAAEVSIERNNRWIGLTQAGKALIQLGRLDEAITTLEEAVRLQETMQEPRAYLAHATALRGNTIRARQLLSELRATPNGDPSRFASPALEAVAEIGLDRRGQALALLADAVESGDPALWLVHDDPVLDRIHSEFAAMVRLPAVDAIAGRPVGRE
jgi:tetratricopeptide (TPR) repeat protein